LLFPWVLNPKNTALTGCLQKSAEPGSYMVTDVEGTGPKTIGIVSFTANLAPYVGHKIEVTGTAVPAKEAEADKNIPEAVQSSKVQ
jgi:hypothetical protein